MHGTHIISRDALCFSRLERGIPIDLRDIVRDDFLFLLDRDFRFPLKLLFSLVYNITFPGIHTESALKVLFESWINDLLYYDGMRVFGIVLVDVVVNEGILVRIVSAEDMLSK